MLFCSQNKTEEGQVEVRPCIILLSAFYTRRKDYQDVVLFSKQDWGGPGWGEALYHTALSILYKEEGPSGCCFVLKTRLRRARLRWGPVSYCSQHFIQGGRTIRMLFCSQNKTEEGQVEVRPCIILLSAFYTRRKDHQDVVLFSKQDWGGPGWGEALYHTAHSILYKEEGPSGCCFVLKTRLRRARLRWGPVSYCSQHFIQGGRTIRMLFCSQNKTEEGQVEVRPCIILLSAFYTRRKDHQDVVLFSKQDWGGPGWGEALYHTALSILYKEEGPSGCCFVLKTRLRRARLRWGPVSYCSQHFIQGGRTIRMLFCSQNKTEEGQVEVRPCIILLSAFYTRRKDHQDVVLFSKQDWGGPGWGEALYHTALSILYKEEGPSGCCFVLKTRLRRARLRWGPVSYCSQHFIQGGRTIRMLFCSQNKTEEGQVEVRPCIILLSAFYTRRKDHQDVVLFSKQDWGGPGWGEALYHTALSILYKEEGPSGCCFVLKTRLRRARLRWGPVSYCSQHFIQGGRTIRMLFCSQNKTEEGQVEVRPCIILLSAFYTRRKDHQDVVLFSKQDWGGPGWGEALYHTALSILYKEEGPSGCCFVLKTRLRRARLRWGPVSYCSQHFIQGGRTIRMLFCSQNKTEEGQVEVRPCSLRPEFFY